MACARPRVPCSRADDSIDRAGAVTPIQITGGVLLGVVAGVLSGLFGIGGGLLIVPALIAFGLTQREAVGTSLLALVLPVGILAVVEYARRGEVRYGYGASIAAGLVGGALLGAIAAGHVSSTALQRAFGVLLLAVAVKFIIAPA